ncbi:hypothetical protein A8924_1132 [Saccharopolyspora erythraea NRRL 2338]|uniref:Uncharacterized protein n=1 Tax=Saccharopolyspora erythraea TaxID=1836 RepID=A0ABN1DUY3_SACER|nr:hypothetical protein N599_06260 [Saccharopolyspora erythraea D]PFG93878.1 hypothetical protein A8924_1132 [Saccharopolyspora erythraea NRRL 2338]
MSISAGPYRADTAHLPGKCNHYGESFDEWGEIHDEPNAWERIKTGEAIPVNAGADRARIARRVCFHCA